MKPSEAIENIEYARRWMGCESDFSEEALDMAIFALKKLEQDRWIPCNERLPEYGTEVLTQLSDNDIVTNWVIDEEDEEWFEDGVVAWRPLPELYEGL
jgi:hypothetical protein